MTRIFSRGLLAKAFPNQPRLRGQMERMDDALAEFDAKRQDASDRLDQFMADIGEGGKYQRAAAILDTISNLPNRIGSIEVLSNGEAAIRPIDGQDPASLLSRGVAYTLFVGIGGRGATADRPVLPNEKAGAIYFDTDLDPDGQPIFWTGLTWVDANGVPV